MVLGSCRRTTGGVHVVHRPDPRRGAGARGLSVEEVAAATRIRRTLVLGIEHDDFSACGGDFYARGHIRNDRRDRRARPGAAARRVRRRAGRDGGPPRATEVFESETGARSERRGPNWSAAMGAALVLVLVYGVAQAVSGNGDDEPTGRARRHQQRPRPAERVSASAVGAARPPAAAAAPWRRRRATRSPSWCTRTGRQLGAGHHGQRQGAVPGNAAPRAGRRPSPTRQRIKLVVGNAGGVTLTVNGTDVGTPGRPGQVARVQFTPQDPAAG